MCSKQTINFNKQKTKRIDGITTKVCNMASERKTEYKYARATHIEQSHTCVYNSKQQYSYSYNNYTVRCEKK